MTDYSKNEEMLNYEPFTSTEAKIKAVGYEETPNLDYTHFVSMVEKEKDWGDLINVYKNYIINEHTSNQSMASILALNNQASLNRYLNTRQQDVKEYHQGTNYCKEARVKHTTTNNVIYYISQKDKNTDALTTPSWKIDNTAFDFTDFTCNNSASNIQLTHKGQMKFVSDYLHNGLHIVFIANKTNTSAISSINFFVIFFAAICNISFLFFVWLF